MACERALKDEGGGAGPDQEGGKASERGFYMVETVPSTAPSAIAAAPSIAARQSHISQRAGLLPLVFPGASAPIAAPTAKQAASQGQRGT